MKSRGSVSIGETTYFAIMGMDISFEMVRIASLLFGWRGLSSFVLPWTPIAATPQLSIILHRVMVSSTDDRSRILQVTGIDKFLTRRHRISLIFSGCLSRAAPIPPLTENSLGQPILTSNPATSFSL